MKILIIDDEPGIRRLIKDFLKIEKIECIEAENGQDGYIKFVNNEKEIKLVIIDVMMPIMNGFEVLSKIREISSVPILMLTAKTDEETQLNSFDNGANDYISKPFSPTILMARIKNQIKNENNNIFKLNDLVINKEKRTVIKGEKLISLTNTEFELLNYFIDNCGKALSREEISTSIWGDLSGSKSRSLDTYVKNLRHKFENSFNISTIRGYGYLFMKE